MGYSYIQDDPVISTLFKAVTTTCIPSESAFKPVSPTYMRGFLENLGVSKTQIRKIITEVFKDIKFLESLHIRISKLDESDSSNSMAAFYLSKLRDQIAYTIAEKILKDDNERNSMLLYAKLQVLRKVLQHQIPKRSVR